MKNIPNDLICVTTLYYWWIHGRLNDTNGAITCLLTLMVWKKYPIGDSDTRGQCHVFTVTCQKLNKWVCLKGCHACKTNSCMAFGAYVKNQSAFCITYNMTGVLTPHGKFLTGKLLIAEHCEVCLPELWGGNKHWYKPTLTLCGFLQCSRSTLSTVMLLGRITTSLLLSLHVSSHSSPMCMC